MAPGGMIYIPNLVMMDSEIQVILRILLQQFEMISCWYYG
jgi:hypothetical protein